jgi:type IV pilus assembly protein PilW
MHIRQSGLSLVELMVAMVIGLVGILAMTQAYLTSDRFNRATTGEGSAQTGGLIALYQMERDVRMAGYGIASSSALGCGTIDWYYDPNYSASIQPGSPLPILTLAPVTITTNGTNPDIVTIMYSTSAERLMPTSITSFVAKSSEVTVDGVYGFNTGDLILLVNSTVPTRCTLGKITQVQAGPQKLQLNPGVSAPYNPPAWGSFPGTYVAGDQMLNLGNPVVRSYSINNNRLRVTDALLQAAGAAPLDIVDSIVDLRAQYGKDNGAGGGTANDGRVDEYNNTMPTTAAEWQQVLSIRMGVLARIGVYEKPTTGTNCDATTTARTWSGGTFTKLDFATVTSEDRCYRYRVFETVVPLRNMIWRAA